MNFNRIMSYLNERLDEWRESEGFKGEAYKSSFNIAVMGGAIVSLLRDEEVNDIDIFFKNEHDKILVTNSIKPDSIEVVTDNAITLKSGIQIITRFCGNVGYIVKGFDFVHTQITYDVMKGEIKPLNQNVLECILTKELEYISNDHPISSLLRAFKYIKRGWSINPGHIFKICLDISELDLLNPSVLAEQFIGIDLTYFSDLIESVEDGNAKTFDGISALLDDLMNRPISVDEENLF